MANICTGQQQIRIIPTSIVRAGTKVLKKFQAPMIWNAINEQVKTGSLSKFKLNLKEQYLSLY